MTLLRGEVQGYDVDRMIVQFTMINDGKSHPSVRSAARRWTLLKAWATSTQISA